MSALPPPPARPRAPSPPGKRTTHPLRSVKYKALKGSTSRRSTRQRVRAVRASAPPGEGEGSVRGRDAEVRCASVCEASVRAVEGTDDVEGRGAGAGGARGRAVGGRAADEVGAPGAGAARLKLNLLLGAAAAFAEANVSCAALSSCARRAQGVSAEAASEKGSRKLRDAHARTGAARRAAGPPLEQSARWIAFEG